MTRIRSIAPRICPNCGAPDSLYVERGAIKCRLCGQMERKTELQPAQAAQVTPQRKRTFRASYSLTHRGEVDKWARAAYDTGQDCVRREDWLGAVEAFERALENQRDFLDAHLWLARLCEAEAVKRDHLTTILAHDPQHGEALRELMLLDGKFTLEQIERIERGDDPEMRAADIPVGMATEVLSCPQCGGDLTVDDASGRVECQACGYHDQRVLSQQVDEDFLTMALLERRATPVRWVVGERLLHCNNCAAERTIASTKLSTRCSFCGSNHIIEKDALDSFQQPDGLIPFSISRDYAGDAIKERLQGWSERIKGWFDNNKVERATLEGIYLPFWVFDSIIDITRTIIDRRTSQGRVAQTQPFTRENIAEMYNNLTVCAITSPPTNLTSKLGQWDLNRMVNYEPELLAKYPAQLYNIDFDKASLEARSVISRHMREKYGQRRSEDVQVNIFSAVKQMSFQLALMPVWVATLIEEDGDIRVGLVNGQNGTVALGRAEKG
jgi:Zn ribbon nucleic-acid-binding protein